MAHPAGGFHCGPPETSAPLLCSLSSSLPASRHHWPLSPPHHLSPLPPTWGPACVLAFLLSCLLLPQSKASPQVHSEVSSALPTRVRACWDLSRPCLTAATSPGCDTWPDADARRTCFGACEFSQNGVAFVQNTELGAENLSVRVGSEPSFLGPPHQGLVRFSDVELGSSQGPVWLWPGDVVAMGQSRLLSTPWPSEPDQHTAPCMVTLGLSGSCLTPDGGYGACSSSSWSLCDPSSPPAVKWCCYLGGGAEIGS